MSTKRLRVLIAGESAFSHTTRFQGVDSFTTFSYNGGPLPLMRALEAGGIEVIHLPSHLAAQDFPTTIDELNAYDVVMISDLGSNTLLLHPDTARLSKPTVNRLALLREWVHQGGAFVMIGGYLTFQGYEAKARYAGTPVEDLLPITMLSGDDRVETPEGAYPDVRAADHPIVAGIDASWPVVLGYNQLVARPEATVIAAAGNDPFLVAWEYGAGRAIAFASDCQGHWLSPEFLAWDGYARMWPRMVQWLARFEEVDSSPGR